MNQIVDRRIATFFWLSLVCCVLVVSADCDNQYQTAIAVKQEPPKIENVAVPHGISLEDYWIDADEIRIDDYKLNRKCSKSTDDIFPKCVLEVRDGSKILRSFESSISIEYGLFPFLGGDRKQLIVHTYTGGAHCCDIYYIFETSPKLRAIFDGDQFTTDEIGYGIRPVDADSDGVFEFSLTVMSFDYELGSHAFSPFPAAVFAYDRKTRKYELANRKYPKIVKARYAEMQEWEENTFRFTKDQNMKLRVTMINKLLFFIYSGKEAEGWSMFDESYNQEDKAEIRNKIQRILEKDPTYRAIYLQP